MNIIILPVNMIAFHQGDQCIQQSINTEEASTPGLFPIQGQGNGSREIKKGGGGYWTHDQHKVTYMSHAITLPSLLAYDLIHIAVWGR